jgi:hypothetical protein
LFLSPFINAGQILAYLQSSGILPVLSDKLNNVVKIGAICVVHSLSILNIATLRQNGQLHSDTKTKSNILNEQFQNAFTPATDDPIPNKGQSQYPQMPNIIITENGINKLLQNILLQHVLKVRR